MYSAATRTRTNRVSSIEPCRAIRASYFLSMVDKMIIIKMVLPSFAVQISTSRLSEILVAGIGIGIAIAITQLYIPNIILSKPISSLLPPNKRNHAWNWGTSKKLRKNCRLTDRWTKNFFLLEIYFVGCWDVYYSYTRIYTRRIFYMVRFGRTGRSATVS